MQVVNGYNYKIQYKVGNEIHETVVYQPYDEEDLLGVKAHKVIKI